MSADYKTVDYQTVVLAPRERQQVYVALLARADDLVLEIEKLESASWPLSGQARKADLAAVLDVIERVKP